MILNRQQRVRVPVRDLEKFLSRTHRRLRLHPEALSICLVTDSEMARWNRAYRGKKGPTDVLSFPANGARLKRNRRRWRGGPSARLFPGSSSYLGDIAIAPFVAQRNARRFGRSLSDEMRILILHGILHLMGYDHETDQGQMDRREQRLRRELGLN
jgi:probable rRNA maturation factor